MLNRWHVCTCVSLWTVLPPKLVTGISVQNQMQFVLVRGSCTLNSVFWHLPPNSARFGYATEGVFFISTQLSTDAVSTLQKVWVLIRLLKQPSAEARM